MNSAMVNTTQPQIIGLRLPDFLPHLLMSGYRHREPTMEIARIATGGCFRQAHQACHIIHNAGLEEGHRRALQQLAEGDPAEVLVAERML